jgi:pimeloyl-ACP methyl ester carboxylesterase
VKRVFAGAEGNRLVADVVGAWPNPRHALLTHGGGQTRHAWGGASKRLAAAGVTAIALDQRGHGESEHVPSKAYGFEDFAADIGAVSGKLSAESGAGPILIGASLGGLASLLAVGEGQVAARALVLVDVTPRMDDDGVRRIHAFMGANIAEGFATLDEAADAVAAYLPHRPRPASLDGLKKNLRLGADGRWWRDGMAECFEAACRGLRGLPTLLVRGASSELVTEEHARAFLDAVPHARFLDVAGARHMVAGDRNDVFADAVLGFVEAL